MVVVAPGPSGAEPWAPRRFADGPKLLFGRHTRGSDASRLDPGLEVGFACD